MLTFTIRSFGSDSLEGASQITLLSVSALCVLIGMVFLHVPWASFEKAITKNVASVASALTILLFIGALSGAWMVSGVVPTLISYGIQLIHPDIFLASACVICALVSLMTGSSWTTIATIGIALMGIGRAQGFSDGWIAGAIISGAYFGDKISPLSETTVLASGSMGVPLFRHIRYMLITTIPSLTIALILFTIGGILCTTNDSQNIMSFTAALEQRFHITPWLLAVPVLTGVMIARRWPPLITLFLSTLTAIIFGLIFQTDVFRDIDPSLFKAAMKSVYGSTSVADDIPVLTELVSTRGMAGMMDTIWLIICAMCFGGAMTASGMLESLTAVFLRFMKRRVGMIMSTVFSGLFLNICTADQYISIILSANMFKEEYEQQGYESRLLSRSAEDGATVTSVLIPWNTCGMTQATVLGVATLTYLPFCFFCYLSPLMSIIHAAMGWKIRRNPVDGAYKEDED